MKAKWLVQDTSYWRSCHYNDVQVNRANLKCSNCGFRNHKNVKYDTCPKCNADMRGEHDEMD